MELNCRRQKLFDYKRFVLLWSLLIIAVSAVPLVYGYYVTPSGWTFMGYTANEGDVNQYMAWMEQCRRGHWLINNPYTLENHQRIFFHPLFMVLGKLAALTTLPNIAVYQISKLASGLLLLLVCYQFSCYFIDDQKDRILCFIIISVTGGLAWLQWFDPDLLYRGSFLFSATFRAAGNTFWALYLHPLFSLSILLLLICFLNFQRFMASEKYRYALYAGAALLLLIQLHPFDFLIVEIVLLFQIILLGIKQRDINKRWIIGFLLMTFIASPYVFYLKFVLIKDPVFGHWSKMEVWRPKSIEYLCMYGFVIIFSVFAIPGLLQNLSQKNAFLLSWAIMIPTLVNLPIQPSNIPTRLIEGYHVLLCILATETISKIISWQRLKKYARYLVVGSIVIVSSIGNVWVLTHDMKKLSRIYINFYMPNEIRKGMDWLRENTGENDAVLASNVIGQFIPNLAGNKVFFGHWALTVNWSQKNKMAIKYFDNRTSDAERFSFLDKWNIRYIFYSPLEKSIGNYRPDSSPHLVLVYQNSVMQIYRFKEPVN